MDTLVTVRAIAASDAAARAAVAAAWAEMDECVLRLDRRRGASEAWLKGDENALRDPAQRPSDVWLINHGAGKWAAKVDPLVTSCLATAKEVFDLTEGAFDPTVGPLLDLWKEAETRGSPPSDAEIATARGLVGFAKVEVLVAELRRSPDELGIVAPGTPPPTPEELAKIVCTVGLPAAGMRLDLGGVAKGYIAGRMASRMKQAGAVAGLVAAAGDVFAFGERPALLAEGRDRRWGVAVQDPRDPEGRRPYTFVHIKDQGVDTSGHYYRGYTVAGRRYSHIFDPRTGRPVDSRIASVTVVARDPGIADALATAICVMGTEKGLALVADLVDVHCLILEVDPSDAHPPQAGGAPSPEANLIAHRSAGFAALEFKPAEP